MIKNTGIVKAGFNKYLIDGFKRGMPPTEAIEMKKKTILINVKQKPIEYMSFLLNGMRLSELLFKKYFGRTADPIKKAIKPISKVITRLDDGKFIDKIRNNENKKITING